LGVECRGQRAGIGDVHDHRHPLRANGHAGMRRRGLSIGCCLFQDVERNECGLKYVQLAGLANKLLILTKNCLILGTYESICYHFWVGEDDSIAKSKAT